MGYLDTTRALYREAALTPQAGLCCVSSRARFLPGLTIPDAMREMNYGCGTTVHFGDISPGETILYIGVGGGLERLRDEAGFIIPRDIPHPVCQKTADYFRKLNRCDVVVTAPTYHYNGSGGRCC